MGDSINLAARIMCQPLAKEDILCDDRTYSLCKKDFDLEHLGTCVVKGKPHPVDIYKPKDMLVRKKGLGNQVPEIIPAEEPLKLVGRDQEKSKLREITDRCRRGEHVRMVIEGEGGQGLTTLTAYLREQAQEKRVLIAYVCHGVTIILY
jgi:class 3 adenylate cyclase